LTDKINDYQSLSITARFQRHPPKPGLLAKSLCKGLIYEKRIHNLKMNNGRMLDVAQELGYSTAEISRMVEQGVFGEP